MVLVAGEDDPAGQPADAADPGAAVVNPVRETAVPEISEAAGVVSSGGVSAVPDAIAVRAAGQSRAFATDSTSVDSPRSAAVLGGENGDFSSIACRLEAG